MLSPLFAGSALAAGGDGQSDVDVDGVGPPETMSVHAPKTWREHFYTGRQMLHQGRFRKAEEHFLACTILEPKNNAARFGMAEVYEHTGRFNDAILVYRQIMNRKPLNFMDERRIEAAKYRLEFYRSLGNPNAPDYLKSDDYNSWAKLSFPLKVAIWSDPELKHLKEPFRRCVVDAFEHWKSASGGKATYKIVDQQQSADVVCKLVRVMRAGGGNGLGMKAGETLRQWDDIKYDAVKWSRVEMFWNEHWTIAQLESGVMHEVGHVLGLDHSSNPHDIMFPVEHPPFAALLSERDKNSMYKLYNRTRKREP